MRVPRFSSFTVAVAALVLASAGGAVAASGGGATTVGPSTGETPNGRVLQPAGRMTTVGNYPTGGALTPDGQYFWAVDSGYGHDDVTIVSVASGKVVQTLPLPGAYGGIAFSADGSRAYVSGEPQGVEPATGPTVGGGGDVIHVFAVTSGGTATEQTPITLPATSGGTAQKDAANPVSFVYQPPGPGASSGLGWPIGLAVNPAGTTLVVALNQADEADVISLATGTSTLVKTGKYPFGVVADATDAYVSNEYDGTISVINLASDTVTSTIVDVGGPMGDLNAHPEGMTLDSAHHRLFVAVANRDLVAVVDTQLDSVRYLASVARPGGLGTSPVAVAMSPDGTRLYAADAGEDAIAVIDLGVGFGAGSYSLVGRIPTAAYPTGVAVTPDGSKLLWLSAQGLGTGANPDYGENYAASQNAPYGQYDLEMFNGIVGVLAPPTDKQAAADAQVVSTEVVPADYGPPPTSTPVESTGGGPSTQIKHVFVIVKENRTYDQIFGSDPNGNGDPSLELFDDNGVSGPTGGVTPNAHALAGRFGLLDNFYEDSQVSVDGHLITSGGYATDFVQRAVPANYSNRGRSVNFGQDPVTLPPEDFLFDQAVRQGVSFQDFGEYNAGNTPQADDGRATYAQSQAGFVGGYPLFFGCDGVGIPVTATDHAVACDTDSGTMGPTGASGAATSRFDFFQADFDREVAAGDVPSLSYLTLPNDHTNGVSLNYPTPQALVADNDLGLGQIVDLISHSSIWSSSAIFVEEDDSQDGADHVDAHRSEAFVISPYSRSAPVHTRYDQESMLRTVELIVGLKPLSLYDADAEPMYDSFTTAADPAPYTAVTPTQSLAADNTAVAPGIDAVLPYDIPDLVPQHLFDDALYRSVYGDSSTPPPDGPDASPAEITRGAEALAVFDHGGDVTDFLRNSPLGDSDG